MNRNKKTRSLTLSTDTIRRLGGGLSPDDLTRVAGGFNTQTICPTVMQTHCYSCRGNCITRGGDC